MTTQLPNGYEAVKVPEGISRVSISDDYEGPNALSYMVNEHWYYSALPSTGYRFLGRADELTEEQCRKVVEGFYSAYARVHKYMDYQGQVQFFLTALQSFRSLLASLHLEPHTTIILKNRQHEYSRTTR